MPHIKRRIYKYYESIEFWLLQQRLMRFPRYTAGHIRFKNWTINFIDAASLITMLRLQILNGYNDFFCDKSDPLILDCGANIGISVLRYKQLYPDARIIAFEPDPKVCQILRHNILRNKVTKVDVIEAAVWVEDSDVAFIHEGSDSGHIVQNQCREGEKISVKAVALTNYLQEPIDFLKLDIEGAELLVLSTCKSLLTNINKLIVEVHYWVDKPNELTEIINILYQAGFNIAINSLVSHIDLRRQYVRRANLSGDQFPALYAWK